MIELFFSFEQNYKVFAYHKPNQNKWISDEAMDWLEENLGPECKTSRYTFEHVDLWLYKIEYTDDSVKIIFKYEEDAILFKLTWGGL